MIVDQQKYHGSSIEYLTLDNGGEYEMVHSHQASDGNTSVVDKFCLQEAEYIFTIIDLQSDGLCCEYGVGNYNVTSNGILIVEGG